MPIRTSLRFVFLLTLCSCIARAGEGMWMLHTLSTTVGNQLKSSGLLLPVDSLYQSDRPSLKDAVVQFGSGCTGEVVSSQGLVLTNHHCGYSQIQSLSTLEKNYLDSGFWARSFDEELPCPGLTVTFIREIRNVTEIIAGHLPDTLAEAEREQRIRSLSDSLVNVVTAETGLSATVRSFFHGNEYHLFVTEVFRDVRLVGTPPETIGNFGSETDNWIWPRHTGDFSVFRIYAGKDNKPAAYSADNVPYKPGRWFPVQTAGLKEGDFTMVFGFPGKTNLYLPFAGLRMVYDQSNPDKIVIRQLRLSAWDDAMAANDTIRLQYAAKNRTLANSYKKWKGELEGIRKRGTLTRVQREERAFRQWVVADPARPAAYRQCLDELNLAYGEWKPLSRAVDFYAEALFGVELLSAAKTLLPLLQAAEADSSAEAQQRMAGKLHKSFTTFYKNYNLRLDRLVAGRLLPLSYQQLPAHLRPSTFQDPQVVTDRWIDSLFVTTLLAQQDTLLRRLHDWKPEYATALSADPLIRFVESVASFQAEQIDKPVAAVQRRIGQWQRVYMKARMEQAGKRALFPDANSTLRLTFGKVEGLHPRDGVHYDWQTTIAGILEKAATGAEDYRIPERLRALAADAENQPVAFLASNHTTGGNSGSPVLNARGELIGINFDRVWEGVMSDLDYNPAMSRNISVDIRYVLFVISKYGGADRLLHEMEIRGGKPVPGKR